MDKKTVIIPNMEQSWKEKLDIEFQKDYFMKIKDFLLNEKLKGSVIYPEEKNIFKAFDIISFDKVKVVILWQDPYHGAWQAHGLSFSVPEWIKQPPSLKNIFKELHSDIGMAIPEHWNLEKWAKQGVLLLNAILTVQASSPASHSKIGWGKFTDAVIKKLSDEREWIVFLLWWAFAQGKKSLIDTDKHYVLETTHPSPFSSYRGFLGSKHFSKTNEILEKIWKEKIDWTL